MKVLSRYEFVNDKAFETRYLNASDRKQAGIAECDGLALRIELPDKDITTYYMRPDEALILARMLTDAVWRSSKSFEYGLIRFDGFKEQ